MAITTSNIANITEHETRLNLSNLVVKFSNDNFKDGLKSVIATSMTEKDGYVPVPRELFFEPSISRKYRI